MHAAKCPLKILGQGITAMFVFVEISLWSCVCHARKEN